MGAETRDVCAWHASNLPGQVNFTPLAPVWPGHGLVLALRPFYLSWGTTAGITPHDHRLPYLGSTKLVAA